jgi:hypothetical protein
MALVRIRAECRGRVELHEIDGSEIEIGRGEDCDLVIDHPTVAPKHARVLCRRGRLILADLGRSKTGTTRGRERVLGPVMLNPGERFRVGDVSLCAWTSVEVDRSLVGRDVSGAAVMTEIESSDGAIRRYRVLLPGEHQGELAVLNKGLENRIGEAWLERARGSADFVCEHIPRVFAVGLFETRHFLVEAIPSGVRLAALLEGVARGAVRLPVEATIVIVAHLAQSVAAMNVAWGPHGSIDPRRVHLGLDGSVVVLRPGIAGGTPDSVADTYLAPERRYGSPPTLAADAFALGVLGKSVLCSRSDCPTRIRAICYWLAHVDPMRRPHDLQEVAQELRRAAQGAGLDPTFGHVARVTRLLSTHSSRRLCSVPPSGRVVTPGHPRGSDEMLV